MNLEATAIRTVTFYQATPVETCDRCGTGIKNVFAVMYKDGQVQKYGSECINKILNNQPSLKTLFNKNAAKLKLFKDYVLILSGSVDQMPRGSEYYGSGLYFVADSNGKDIAFGHYYFHPVFDAEKNANGEHYVVPEGQEQTRFNKCVAEIQADLPKLQTEITRLETFLAKVLRNAAQACTASKPCDQCNDLDSRISN